MCYSIAGIFCVEVIFAYFSGQAEIVKIRLFELLLSIVLTTALPLIAKFRSVSNVTDANVEHNRETFVPQKFPAVRY